MPPDSIVTLWTDRPVDRTLISIPGFLTCDHITILYAEPPTPHPCSVPGSWDLVTCFNITLQQPLAPGEECGLAFSRTMPYAEHSGAWRGEISISLTGYIPFQLVFYDHEYSREMSSRRLSMAIQHGLPSGLDLTSVIILTPPVAEYEAVVRNKSRVVLSGELVPGTRYVVHVIPPTPPIMDNVGMPLERSTGNFYMAEERADLMQDYGAYHVTQLPLFDTSQGYPLVTRAAERWSVTACPVTVENLPEALRVVVGYRRDTGMYDPCAGIHQTGNTSYLSRGLTQILNDTVAHVPNVSIITVIDSTRPQWYHTTRFVTTSTLQVLLSPVIIGGGPLRGSDGEVEAVVLRNVSGLHVQLTDPIMADIQLWGSRDQLVYNATTDPQGYLFVSSCPMCEQQSITVVVLIDDNVVYIHPARIYLNRGSFRYDEGDLQHEEERRPIQLHVTLIPDRGLYAPGGVLMMAGWILSSTITCLACQPADFTPYVFNLTVTWSPSLPKVILPLPVDGKGAISPFNITVPMSVPLGSYPTFTVHSCSLADPLVEATAPQHGCDILGLDVPQLLIAEPRVPIAVMDLIVPSLTTVDKVPTSNDTYVTIATYSGTPLAGTAVDVRVTVRGPSNSVSTCGYSSEDYDTYAATYETNDEGVARISLFDDIEGPWTEGQTIEVRGSSILW